MGRLFRQLTGRTIGRTLVPLVLALAVATSLVSNARAGGASGAGGAVWVAQYGSSASDEHTVALTATGSGVYIIGNTNKYSTGNDVDVFIRKYSPSKAVLWSRQFGIAYMHEAAAMSVDSTGVYIVGHVWGTLPGDPNAAWVRKYDHSGSLLWHRQFGTSGGDAARAVAVNSTGVYVAGYTTGEFPGQDAGSGQVDAFVRKYGKDGSHLWTRQFGSSDSAYGQQIELASDGVYVAGDVWGPLPGQTQKGGKDAFVRKYDHSGAVQWTRQFGTPTHDELRKLVAGATGVYLAGHSSVTMEGDDPVQDRDVFVRKYSPTGALLWSSQIATESWDHISGLVVSSAGVFVAGSVDRALPGQVHRGRSDGYLRKYTASGTVAWTRQFGGQADDHASGLAMDTTGVYLTGWTDGDIFVRKYSPAGVHLWVRQFGTAQNEWEGPIAVNATGVYVAGGTFGAFPGYSNSGRLDAFVARLWLS